MSKKSNGRLASQAKDRNMDSTPEVEYQNEVRLRGRCSQQGVEKELPSGDKVVELRVVVKRDDRDGYDTLDLAAWSAALRKKALRLQPEEWIEVEGVLRRRFWNSGGIAVSRWQVEARELRRI